MTHDDDTPAMGADRPGGPTGPQPGSGQGSAGAEHRHRYPGPARPPTDPGTAADDPVLARLRTALDELTTGAVPSARPS